MAEMVPPGFGNVFDNVELDKPLGPNDIKQLMNTWPEGRYKGIIPCNHLCIRCDGSIDTDHGKSPGGIETAYGFIITTDLNYPIAWDHGRVPKEEGVTVNVGEYFAVIKALELLDGIGPAAYHDFETRVYSDSQLIIRQINGEYSVTKPHLKRLRDRVRELAAKWKKITFIWVPREQNEMADKLATSTWETP